MRLGKLTNEQLQTLILSKYHRTRSEVVVHPDVGVDCTAVDFSGDLCVLSTDPITSASNNLGRLAVHVCCNDAAAFGAQPIGLLITLLLPPSADEAYINKVADEVAQAAKEAGVDVLGGHTEVTDAVTRPVISATVVAKAPKTGLITSAGMQEGDDLVLTKWAGIEGTSIIAADFEERLDGVLTEEEKNTAKMLSEHLSVVKESVIASRMGAHAMHDVTEGGVLGAAWEMAEASRCSLSLFMDAIPVLPITRKICVHFALDPYKLLSSGCMLIACKDGERLSLALSEAGIAAAVIGKAKSNGVCTNGVFADGKKIEPPEADEILKLFSTM